MSASQRSARPAYSGAGTKVLRIALGNARIISVTSSVRIPGTCQENGMSSIWLSTASGISTLTPSRGSPGENR